MPVTLKRRLLRLVPGDKAFEFRAEEVGKDEISSADLYLDDARASMSANIVGAGYRPQPEILCAELGSRAGMIGVADLARELL